MNNYTREDLKNIADMQGIQYKKNIPTIKLQQILESKGFIEKSPKIEDFEETEEYTETDNSNGREFVPNFSDPKGLQLDPVTISQGGMEEICKYKGKTKFEILQELERKTSELEVIRLSTHSSDYNQRPGIEVTVCNDFIKPCTSFVYIKDGVQQSQTVPKVVADVLRDAKIAESLNNSKMEGRQIRSLFNVQTVKTTQMNNIKIPTSGMFMSGGNEPELI